MKANHIRGVIAALTLTVAAHAFASRVSVTTSNKDGVVTTTRQVTADGTTTEEVSADPAELDRFETRSQLSQVLRGYAPELGMSLKIDPTLFNNHEYMANYPVLVKFVTAHPEVVHNSRFYLEEVSIRGDSQPDPPTVRVWRDGFRDLGAFAVFLIVTGTLAWLIKTLIEQRRWSRLSRVQTETHSKILDRFASSEELLRYIQTPAGQRFLESAPIPLREGPRALSAPIGRILWSVQVGLVLAAAGLGIQFVSGRIPQEASQAFFAIGTVLLSVGAGFVISAIVSFYLSRSLGLWSSPAAASDEGSQG